MRMWSYFLILHVCRIGHYGWHLEIKANILVLDNLRYGTQRMIKRTRTHILIGLLNKSRIIMEIIGCTNKITQ